MLPEISIMLKNKQYVILLCVMNIISSLRQVSVSNQSEPILVMEGRSVRLSCSIYKPWFFCLWDSPSGKKEMECAIQYFQPERVCSKSNKTKLIAHKDSCDVQFVVIHDTENKRHNLLFINSIGGKHLYLPFGIGRCSFIFN